MVRSERLTALTKPDGGVRGIVAGDVIRRFVARTMAQQMAEMVEQITAPNQYALSTRAGCECVAHVLQGLTELDPETTVTSVDCIGAYDTISSEAMLRGLRHADDTALFFVTMFYGSPSEYWWEDNEGMVHRIQQSEGGARGRFDAILVRTGPAWGSRLHPHPHGEDEGLESSWCEASDLRRDGEIT